MSEVGKKSKPIAKRRSKKKKDPAAPKKPRSAYIIFCTDERASVKKSHPDAKPADILKIMAEMWRKIDDNQKKEYTAKATEDKDRYNEEMRGYTPPEPESEDEVRQGKKVKKPKKKKKDPNEPKRGQTAYIMFGNKQRPLLKNEDPSRTQSDIMKLIGHKWNAMSEEEKKPYHEEANADKKRYEAEKNVYDNKKKDEAGQKMDHSEDDEGHDAEHDSPAGDDDHDGEDDDDMGSAEEDEE